MTRPRSPAATHVTAEERARLATIEDRGMVDAYRTLHPTEVQYTWWDYREGSFHKGLGMRIDLALVSSGLADRLRACGIDREYRKGTKPSDHAPLLLDLAGAGPLMRLLSASSPTFTRSRDH